LTDAIASPDRRDPVLIRDMVIDDLAPVFHLGEQLFKNELYPTLYRTWDEWEVTGLYNTDPEYCLIAEVDGEFAGFVLGTVIEKQLTYGYINWLGVDHKFQRRGVADSLVDRFVERTIHQGARSLFIDTDPANEPAVKFFARKGFGNVRQHIYMSLDLSRHEYYGRLIDYEQDQVERTARKHRRRPKG
jgi:ribosomal protein S18 acetylase RimI-like enzyme